MAFSKTLYFAVGYFTDAQRQQQDRATLAAGTPRGNPTAHAVVVTVYQLNTGASTLNIGIDGESSSKSGPYLHMERFLPDFPPPNRSAADAFADYLKSPEGVAAFEHCDGRAAVSHESELGSPLAPMDLQVNFGDETRGSLIYPVAASAADGGQGLPVRTIDTNSHVSSPLVFRGIFSAEECDLITELGRRRPLREGRMMYARMNRRKSTIAWIGVGPDTLWLYEKLWQVFLSANRWYAFNLSGFIDELQYTLYEAGDGFDWHLDTGSGQTSTRKISVSVQLADESNYTDGDLEFSGCLALDAPRGRGTIIVFPSFLAHRVTRVTRGMRTSLVAWAHGPAFK